MGADHDHSGPDHFDLAPGAGKKVGWPTWKEITSDPDWKGYAKSYKQAIRRWWKTGNNKEIGGYASKTHLEIAGYDPKSAKFPGKGKTKSGNSGDGGGGGKTQYSDKRLSDFLKAGKLTTFKGQVDPAARYGTKQILKRYGDFFWQWNGHHGWRQKDGYNEHYSGRAIDLMIGDRYRESANIKTGNEVAKFIMTNASVLGISSVIWRQRIWTRGSAKVDPSEWREMGDRGSDTANHYDHLHISYIDNTNDFGNGKIKEMSGGYSNPGRTGSGGSGGGGAGYGDGDSDDGSGGSKMRVNAKPYKSGSARRSFANTLVARLGFTEEQARNLADLVKKAKNNDEAMGLVYGSDIYKERFKGNELRKEAGLKPISESEYITLEREYAKTLQKEGIKEGLFDEEDFAEWIANDISNLEVSERVEQYRGVVDQWDDSMKEAMSSLYGMDKGDFLAFAMKPTRGQLQKLEKRSRALEIADAAIEEGFGKVLKQGKKAREWVERIATSGDENVNAEDVFESQRLWNESGSNDMQKSLGFSKRSQREQIEDAFGVEGRTGMSEDSRRRKMKKTMNARFKGSGGGSINAYRDDSFDTDF